MRAGGEIMEALDLASKGVQAASTELSKLTQEFHDAGIDDNGELVMGVGLQFDIAVKEELAVIYTTALENDRRPPAEDIRAAMAERAVRTKKPDLWMGYHHTKARIDALKGWISNQKSSISANQSLLRGEAT